MRHSAEEPHRRVAGGLLETLRSAGFTLVGDGIELHSVVGEVPLVLREPPSGQGEVGQQEKAGNCDDKCDSALEDEEPLPACNAGDVIHAVEDAGSDEAGKGSSQNVTSVENRDSGSDLLTRVEDGEDVNGAGVIGRFCEPQEEASEEEAFEVLGHSRESAHNSPEHHHGTLFTI